MDIILRPFAWLLLMLYNLVNNYGIALLLFAVLVKLILFPVSLKGKRSMIKMNMLNGKIQKLQKMYGNNTPRFNEEVQKIYTEEGVNPMGGCLWSMIPLFILIPLYSVIRQPLHYMMNLTPEQITAVANALNWGQVSIDMGWVKTATDAVSNVYTSGSYNELFLTSLINEGNLATVQAAVGEGAKVFAMNFDFMGIDLSQIPNWKFWINGMDWTTIGLFLLVVVSAVTGIVSSRVMMKTNNMNNQQNEQAAQTNRMMMWMTPLMSLWIGFIMPGLLCVYWIGNNILSMVQELIAGKMLKKDYEEAARLQAENAAREKEEEKARKREVAERKAREKEEAKNKKKAATKVEEKKDLSVIEVSRVGMRPYARGRSYDPNRYGGVTVYKDPSAPVNEEAVETALTAKAEQTEQGATAEENIEMTAPVEEQATTTAVENVEEDAVPVSEETVEEAVETEVEDTEVKE